MKQKIKLPKEKIVKILKENGIKRAGIFGSYAKGEQNKDSDVDILIKPTKDMNLLDISHIELELERNLQKKIDLLTYNGINHLLKKRILKEEIKII